MLSLSTDPADITSSPDSVRDILTGVSWSGSCEVTGTPEPTITFYYNGEPLESGGGIEINGGTITITSTTLAHRGMYQCAAENESGSAERNWFLIIREPSTK